MMKVYKIVAVIVASIILSGYVIAEDISGYTIEEFLGYTVFSEVKVSPNGKYIALITLNDDFEKDQTIATIWRIDIDEAGNKKDTVRLTFAEGSYFNLRWSPDERYLTFLSTRKPAEAPQLFAIDMHGGEPMLLNDPRKFKEGIIDYDWLPDGNGLIFAAPNLPDEEQEKAYKEFYGDAKRFVEQKPQTTFWRLIVNNFPKQIAEAFNTVDMPVEKIRISPDGNWIAYLSGSPKKPAFFYNGLSDIEIFLLSTNGKGTPRQMTHNFVWDNSFQWDIDGKYLYIIGTGELDTNQMVKTQSRIYKINIEDSHIENLVSDFDGSFSELAQTNSGLILSNVDISTRINLYNIDPKVGTTKQLSDYRGATLNISTSKDGKLIAFVLSICNSFPELYISKGIEKLTEAVSITDFNAKFSQKPIPEIEKIEWDNGEGDKIEGVLYWPPGQRNSKNLPFVVDIHGGPEGAMHEVIVLNVPIEFAYYPALLASRGYLVLEPNYRGGTGRGDNFLRSINGYASSRPSNDILKGVDYIIAKGWADPNRMGVMGYSYGGILTNYIITQTNRFQVACSGAGIWNWMSDFGTSIYGFFDEFYFIKSPWENFQNYWNESAISGAGKIQTPTLITTGDADRVCATSQSYELYRSLVWLGIPTELLVFPGEEHVFQKPSHKRTKVKAEIAWLDHYLLGTPLPDIK